ncbi:hypothetical protein Ndes2526B_g01582 [Nannochloris sp. 'desiccata']|nr:hypothetical protein KSW81_005913 [Chlorella desiccata (nom. nud.)]KAH7623165.1 hypothetical protein NADE_002359 [Chlorella desiccata (nom. nud.)]
MEGHRLSIRPSAELILSELEYLREFEGDITQPQSATQSDCGQAAPSLSFPSFAPSPSAPASPTATAISQEQEEQTLHEWDKLQKIRGAAVKAAQIARHQAEEVARLTAAIAAEEGNKTAFTATRGPLDQPEQGYVAERTILWPPDSSCVPADYNLTSHNAPVLHARAQRVEELGTYYFTTASTTTQSGRDDADTIREAAEKVGGYQNLAKKIRERIKKPQQQQE